MDLEEKRGLKAAVIQLNCRINAAKRNMKKAEELIHRAADEGAELICLPESFATSMNLTDIARLAQPLSGDIAEWLRGLAGKRKVHIAAGFLEEDNGKYYSTSLLAGSGGELIGSCRRRYIYRLEKKYLSAGSGAVCFQTKIGRIGLIGGYDIFYPEVCRQFFKERVQIIVCCALLPDTFEYTVHRLAGARAVENSCYFILASGLGGNQFAGLNYMGNSRIVGDPVWLEKNIYDFLEGEEVLAKGGKREEIVSARLILEEMEEYHKENPLYLDYI